MPDNARFDPPLSERERDAIEAMRTAVKVVGGEEPVPYDLRGLANEIVRARSEVERLQGLIERLRARNAELEAALSGRVSPSRDGTWAERFRRAADEAERRGPSEGIDPLIHTAMVEAYRTQADDLSSPPPEYMTEADAHRWVDEHVDPPVARHVAHSLVSSLPRVAPSPSRDGTEDHEKQT